VPFEVAVQADNGAAIRGASRETTAELENLTPRGLCRLTDSRFERVPNSLRIVSRIGNIVPARLARITRSHSGSNFFQPVA
jgi:hypothetical protein